MDLRDKFAALGADDPDEWARSELKENIPQLARLRFLRGMRAIVDRYGPSTGNSVYQDGDAARERLLALGAAPEDLQAVERSVAHEALFSALHFMDDPGYNDDDTMPDLPGWALMETVDDKLTGRPVQALYEDMDPDR